MMVLVCLLQWKGRDPARFVRIGEFQIGLEPIMGPGPVGSALGFIWKAFGFDWKISGSRSTLPC